MLDITAMLQNPAAASIWLLLPSAIVLGALHGLEPGHSKTMMAAFIIAVRGTLAQAVLLGLAATVSHTAVVWVIALAGLYFGRQGFSEASEPYLQLLSAALIAAVALWMLWRTWCDQHAHDDHDHSHKHEHEHEHGHTHEHVHHADEPQTAHERLHAEQIKKRFSQRQVSTGQIVIFGLTGGLIPCPASITVLLLCLQLKQLALGATLVLGFSIGLALTMVASGAVAALSLRHLSGRWAGFSALAARAPYLSGALMLLLAAYMGNAGWVALH